MDSSFNLAVHALVCLSHSGRSLSSEALAENICTNPTRVRRVLAGLKKAGMVETREGLDGGYRLTVDPASLTLRQVAKAVNTRFVDCACTAGTSTVTAPSAPAWRGSWTPCTGTLTRNAPPISRTLRLQILKHNSLPRNRRIL